MNTYTSNDNHINNTCNKQIIITFIISVILTLATTILWGFCTACPKVCVLTAKSHVMQYLQTL